MAKKPTKPTKALHEVREITFREHLAVLAVRHALETGVLDMHPVLHPDDVNAFDNKHTFHMSCSMDKAHCGSVGCIGGYMALVMGVNSRSYVTDHIKWGHMAEPEACSPSLTPLFFPPLGRDWPSATPKVAVKAIDNWLKDGNPRWGDLLPPEKDYDPPDDYYGDE
jgi:hypothetical protein